MSTNLPTGTRSSLSLLFDGHHLTLKQDGRKVKQFQAVSGLPERRVQNNGRGTQRCFGYSPEQQREKNQGPIPEGEYWILPGEMIEVSMTTDLRRTLGCVIRELRRLKDCHERMVARSWGTHRISIHGPRSGDAYGRNGFFIHGSASYGSLGCIDLKHEMSQFVSALVGLGEDDDGHYIPLTVRYDSAYRCLEN